MKNKKKDIVELLQMAMDEALEEGNDTLDFENENDIEQEYEEEEQYEEEEYEEEEGIFDFLYAANERENDAEEETIEQDKFDMDADSSIADLLQGNLDNLIEEEADDDEAEDRQIDYMYDDQRRRPSSVLKVVIPVGCLAAAAFLGYRSGLIDKFIEKDQKQEYKTVTTVESQENATGNAGELENKDETKENNEVVEEKSEEMPEEKAEVKEEKPEEKAETSEEKPEEKPEEEIKEEIEEEILFDPKKVEVFAVTDGTEDVILYEEPGSAEAGSAKVMANKIVAVEEKTILNEEEWDFINYYGITGWTNSTHLLTLEEERSLKADELIVYADGKDEGALKLYKEPSETSESVSQLEYGEEVEIIQIEGTWGKISHNEELVWINMEDTSVYVPGYYCVNVEAKNTLNVRNEANGNGALQTTLPNGQKIQVDRFDKGWGHVVVNGIEGWVNMRYVKACSETSVSEPAVQESNSNPENNTVVTNSDNTGNDTNNNVNTNTNNTNTNNTNNNNTNNEETPGGQDNPGNQDTPNDTPSEGDNTDAPTDSDDDGLEWSDELEWSEEE